MDNVFTYHRSDEDNYYRLLGCDETATKEQILAEFKVLSLMYHPDKNPNDEDAVCRFQKLVKAKEILIDPEKRAMYDKWNQSGFCVPFEQFLNLNKASHSSVHWVSKRKKDLMLEGGCCSSDTQSGVEECSSKDFYPKVKWERDPACELLKKFRNYEI